jgi:hypothetical protein
MTKYLPKKMKTVPAGRKPPATGEGSYRGSLLFGHNINNIEKENNDGAYREAAGSASSAGPSAAAAFTAVFK